MKLTYFNGRGLAETSRILLAINKVEYEDYRYPINEKWEKPEFDLDKKNGILKQSLNKLPSLEVIDGNKTHVIPQSKAIERYIAKKYNMMGNNDLEAAKIDSICEVVRDIKEAYQTVRKVEESKKEDAMKEWFTKTIVERLILLNNIVDSETHCVGNKLSLADVILYCLITQFFTDVESARKAIQQTPKLNNIVKNVESIKEVQEWINKRPITMF